MYINFKASVLGAAMLFQSFTHQLELRFLGRVVSILLAQQTVSSYSPV